MKKCKKNISHWLFEFSFPTRNLKLQVRLPDQHKTASVKNRCSLFCKWEIKLKSSPPNRSLTSDSWRDSCLLVFPSGWKGILQLLLLHEWESRKGERWEDGKWLGAAHSPANIGRLCSPVLITLITSESGDTEEDVLMTTDTIKSNEKERVEDSGPTQKYFTEMTIVPMRKILFITPGLPWREECLATSYTQTHTRVLPPTARRDAAGRAMGKGSWESYRCTRAARNLLLKHPWACYSSALMRAKTFL